MRLSSTLLLAAVVLAGCAAAPSEPDFYLGGIQVNEPDHGAWIETLRDSGFNTVAVTVYAKQGDWDSDNLWFEEEEPWVVSEIREARRGGLAVVLVLRVALDHAFERNKFLWHGMIMPRTDAQLEEWFRRYRGFVEQWARIAEREGVAVLAVASELNALTNAVPVDELPVLEEYWTNAEKVDRERDKVLEHADEIVGLPMPVRGFDAYDGVAAFLDDKDRAHVEWALQTTYREASDPIAEINRRRQRLEAHWRGVIETARSGFDGELSYAANFDQYMDVPFWDALDLISVNAYFPLRRHLVPETDDGPLLAALTTGWTGHLRALDHFRRERGLGDRPVLFTEIGYVRRRNSTIQPWASDGFSVLPTATGTELVVWQEQPPDLGERALAMRALHEANRALEQESGGELLTGLLYWKLSSVPSHVEVEPFVLLIGPRAPPDPLVDELRRFVSG